MELAKALDLLKQYEDCPVCGNDMIGGGEGGLEVTENFFRRSCSCGWSIEIREGAGARSGTNV